jgi:hypothetical protein
MEVKLARLPIFGLQVSGMGWLAALADKTEQRGMKTGFWDDWIGLEAEG